VQQQMIRGLAAARQGMVRVLAVGFMCWWCADFEWEELAIPESRELVSLATGRYVYCTFQVTLPRHCVLEQCSALALVRR
jgi:hypothetical protein